jgi:hypothetical protein
MKDFSGHLNRIYSTKKRKELFIKPIKVAVIDDGANLESLNLPDVEGWSAWKVPPDPRPGRTWHFSEEGHGTEMVRLVRKVCPFASFFIGKIDTRRECHSSVSESAAKVCNTIYP